MTKPFYFDPESKGFYSEEYHSTIPSTAYILSDEEYQSYINPPKGKYFDCADGVPKFIDIAPIVEPAKLTPEQKLERTGLTVDELKTLLGI
jgi:hypothetical protein